MSLDQTNNQKAFHSGMKFFSPSLTLSNFMATTLKQLAELTNATSIYFLLNDAKDGWLLEAGYFENELLERQLLEEVESKGILPMSAVHHAISSKEALVLANVVNENPFSMDPYFKGKSQCSFLIQPILVLNQIIGILLLEKQGYEFNFNTYCCEWVAIITQQIATSLDNIQRFETLQHRMIEYELTMNNLSKNEQQLDKITNSGSVLIRISGLDKRCSFFNTSWLRFTGISEEQLLNGRWKQCIHPDDVDNYFVTNMAAFERQIAFNAEYRLQHIDTSYRWIKEEATPHYGNTGQFLGYICHGHEITEQKNFEFELEEKEKFLSDLIENSEELIYVKNYTAQYQCVNRKFERITGLNRQEMLNKTDDMLPPNVIASEFSKFDMEILNTDYPENVLTSSKKDKKQRHFLSVKFPLSNRYNKTKGLCNVSTEIYKTLKPNSEQSKIKFDDNDTKFHLLADNAPFAILLFNHANEILYTNKEFTKLLGYSQDDITSLDEWWQCIFPDAQNCRKNQLQMTDTAFFALKNQTQTIPQELSVVCKNGVKKNIVFYLIFSDSFSILMCTANTVRRQSDLVFSQSDECYRVAFEKANVAIGISDKHGFLVKVNERYAEMIGYSAEELVGLNAEVLSPSDDLPAEIDLYYKCLTGELNGYRTEKRYINRNGELGWTEPLVTVVRDEQGEAQYFIGVMVDITERKKSEIALVASEERFRQLFEKIPLPLAILTTTGAFSHINIRFTETFGYTLGETPNLEALWQKAFPDPAYQSLVRQDWAFILNEPTPTYDIPQREYVFISKHGNARIVLISCVSVGDDLMMLFLDISRQKQQQTKLEQFAHYDSLTGLPNRVLLADRLNHAMQQAKRNDQSLAVVYLDLDGFKEVNDRYGHEVGDQLLLTISTRMKLAIRESDTIARLGGDEFVAVLSDLSDAENSIFFSRLLEAANLPVHVEDLSLCVSASLGITFYPQNEEINADQLMRQADQAMYQAKLTGKNRYVIFDPELDNNTRGRHENIEHIRLGLSHNQFILHYQPKVNLRTGEVIGVEALIRWQHPKLGLLIPQKFLPVIENHPLIIEMGEWVIHKALSQVEIWQALGLDLKISVNIAALQLQQHNFVDRLKIFLSQHPIVNPGNIELEVIESSALNDLEHVSSIINECKEIGIHFALDDFGTGYSSLTYLKRLPAKILKIDRSFVRDMLEDPEDLAILEGVIGLASASRRQVIAEGVETVAHGEMLLQIGCNIAQGYGIARPMSAELIPTWLKNWHPDSTWVNCSTLDRENLPLLSAKVEHRAWTKALEDYINGTRFSPPHKYYHLELASWLENAIDKNDHNDSDLKKIKYLHNKIQLLSVEILNNNTINVAKNNSLETLLNLCYEMGDNLKIALRKIKENATIA